MAAAPTGDMARDPLAAFDPEVLSATDTDADRLRTLARRHQETVRENPGVENLVYEWRRGYPSNSLVERTPAAYYLLVAERAWAEFGDALGLDDAERDLLRALHVRQFAAAVGDPADGERAPMVLTRP